MIFLVVGENAEDDEGHASPTVTGFLFRLVCRFR